MGSKGGTEITSSFLIVFAEIDIPLPAASASSVKKPAQPSRIAIKGSPLTVASYQNRKR